MTLKEFMEKPDSAVLAEAVKCGSAEELKGFFESHGVSVTEGEAEKLYAMVSKTKMNELSDEELDGVAGGGYYYPICKCPRGHEGITEYVFKERKYYVDENCLDCEHCYTGPGNKYRYCSRLAPEKVWDGAWYEW